MQLQLLLKTNFSLTKTITPKITEISIAMITGKLENV